MRLHLLEAGSADTMNFEMSLMNGPASLEDLKYAPSGRAMTERAFVEWATGEIRAEWVDGRVVLMAPDNIEHDNLGNWLRTLLLLFVDAHDVGKVCGPDFWVRLPRQRRRRLPDALFVSKNRLQIIERTCVEGAPDLIMEIVSPDSVARDWREKFLEYQRAGVREYWVLDPSVPTIEAYTLGKGGAYQRIKETSGRIISSVLKGFFFRSGWLADVARPKVPAALREMSVKL